MTTESIPSIDLNGTDLYVGWFDRTAQEDLIRAVRGIVRAAPLVRPVSPGGKPLSVRMTSAGSLGWTTDRAGYRYEPKHPSGVDWPPIPKALFRLWDAVSGCETPPDSCLVNFYEPSAKMGMHQDKDEAGFNYPVVSVSLGDEALFRVGGTTRGGKTLSHRLRSGDVVVLGGEARLAYHGIDRIYPGTSTLLKGAGRINLTLRKAGV